MRNDAATAAQLDLSSNPVLDADVNAFGHDARKNHKHVFDEYQRLLFEEMRLRALALQRDDPRRMAFFASAGDKFSNQIFAGTPNEDFILSPRE